MAKRKTTKQRNEELAKEGKILRHYGLHLRMEPNEKQKEQIHHTSGCARFTFNFFLGEKKEVYKLTQESLSSNEFKKSFNGLKEHPVFAWLKKADKFALESALEAVDDAFTRFFNGQNRFPRFKSKRKSEQGYTTKETNGNIKLDIEKQTVQLPKLGRVKVRLSKKHRQMFQESRFNGKIKTATIKYHSSGQYYVSLKMEEMVPLHEKVDFSQTLHHQMIGIDLGLNHFYIDSMGKKVENPKFLNVHLKKLAKLQRQLKNKKIGSSNYKKLQRKISKLHLHIAYTRKDFLHKESHKLVNENQVIILEDLNVKGMIKNKKLARSIADVSWSMFKTFISYKVDWANKKVVFIDRFFASSKQCSGCKEKNQMLSLSDREWVCSKCGTKHDRDINAAKNIKEEGIRLLQEQFVFI
jgi:putative transposase